jgi:hypothetical protein
MDIYCISKFSKQWLYVLFNVSVCVSVKFPCLEMFDQGPEFSSETVMQKKYAPVRVPTCHECSRKDLILKNVSRTLMHQNKSLHCPW